MACFWPKLLESFYNYQHLKEKNLSSVIVNCCGLLEGAEKHFFEMLAVSCLPIDLC